MKRVMKLIKVAAICALALSQAGCDPHVYGSVGYGTGWGHHGGGFNTSISVGGRIF